MTTSMYGVQGLLGWKGILVQSVLEIQKRGPMNGAVKVRAAGQACDLCWIFRAGMALSMVRSGSLPA